MQDSNSADQHSLVYDLQEPCYYSVLDVEPDARYALLITASSSDMRICVWANVSIASCVCTEYVVRRRW